MASSLTKVSGMMPRQSVGRMPKNMLTLGWTKASNEWHEIVGTCILVVGGGGPVGSTCAASGVARPSRHKSFITVIYGRFIRASLLMSVVLRRIRQIHTRTRHILGVPSRKPFKKAHR